MFVELFLFGANIYTVLFGSKPTVQDLNWVYSSYSVLSLRSHFIFYFRQKLIKIDKNNCILKSLINAFI